METWVIFSAALIRDFGLVNKQTIEYNYLQPYIRPLMGCSSNESIARLRQQMDLIQLSVIELHIWASATARHKLNYHKEDIITERIGCAVRPFSN